MGASRIEIGEAEGACLRVTSDFLAVIDKGADIRKVTKHDKGGLVRVNDKVRVLQEEDTKTSPFGSKSPRNSVFFANVIHRAKLAEGRHELLVFFF